MADTAIGGAKPVNARKSRGFWLDLLIRLVREKPLGALGGLIFLILLFVGVFADFIAYEGENVIHPIDRLQAASAKYWFGTDQIGRDLFSRMVFGAQLSVIVAFSATTLSIIVSIVIGLSTGYIGGKFDLVVQRFVDAWMSFPDLIILIVAVSVLGPGIDEPLHH